MKVALAKGFCCALAFLVICNLPLPAGAAPPNCSFTISDVAFGDIDLTTYTTYDTTSTFSASCTGDAKRKVRICPNVSSGDGGSSSGDPRFMTNGGTTLNFNLFQDAARNTVWGSYLWGFASYTPPTIDLLLDGSGSGSTARSIYARVYAGQQSLPAGTYTSSFSGQNTTIKYDYADTGTCPVISGSGLDSTAPFTVTANYPAACRISANTLDFGTAGNLGSNVDGSSTLTATCSSQVAYNIGLNAGNGWGATVALRKMTNGGRTINYSLYINSARTVVWGETPGTDTVSGTGSGLAQTYTVYGRVPAQATPAPAIYSDTIITTITY